MHIQYQNVSSSSAMTLGKLRCFIGTGAMKIEWQGPVIILKVNLYHFKLTVKIEYMYGQLSS